MNLYDAQFHSLTSPVVVAEWIMRPAKQMPINPMAIRPASMWAIAACAVIPDKKIISFTLLSPIALPVESLASFGKAEVLSSIVFVLLQTLRAFQSVLHM